MSAPPRRIPPASLPDPGDARAAQMEAAERRRLLHEQHQARRPALLEALAAGPELADLDAAADCSCTCHPSLADPLVHGGGSSCPCQQTLEERREATHRFLDAMRVTPDPEAEAEAAQRRERFETEADRLGVELNTWGGWAPFQIHGVVSGRAFYFRLRYGTWRLEAALDETPLKAPMGLEGAFLVASGDEADLEVDGEDLWVVALRRAVDAVETFLWRRDCPHVPEADEVRFCPRCGVRLRDADAWRV